MYVIVKFRLDNLGNKQLLIPFYIIIVVDIFFFGRVQRFLFFHIFESSIICVSHKIRFLQGYRKKIEKFIGSHKRGNQKRNNDTLVFRLYIIHYVCCRENSFILIKSQFLSFIFFLLCFSFGEWKSKITVNFLKISHIKNLFVNIKYHMLP